MFPFFFEKIPKFKRGLIRNGNGVFKFLCVNIDIKRIISYCLNAKRSKRNTFRDFLDYIYSSRNSFERLKQFVYFSSQFFKFFFFGMIFLALSRQILFFSLLYQVYRKDPQLFLCKILRLTLVLKQFV